jgi:transposase
MYLTVTRKKYKETYHEQILLRESYREDGKVKTRTIANLTKQPKYQIEALAVALKTKKDEPLFNTSNQEQGYTVGFSLVILFIAKLLGITTALGKSFEAKIAMVLIAARIVLQSSRLQALYWSQKEDKILDLLKLSDEEKGNLTDKTIYKGLDYLYSNQEIIENKLFKSYYKNNPPKRVFYDVTSSYVEGDYKDSELVNYGYNRDKKKGKKQIVVGLLADEDGHGISIHIYPGNTNDVATFADQLDKLKRRFKLENITVVGDGGMIKSKDIQKIKELGYDYITSIGKPSIEKLIKDNNSKIDATLFDENLQELVEGDVRYIIRQNPIRRDEIRETRESKITRLQELIDTKVKYYNTHYQAKQETLLKHIDKKIADLKLSSFISYEIELKDGNCSLKAKDGSETTKTKELATITLVTNTQAKQEIEKLDGCYVVTTSLVDTTKDTKEDIHKAYKTLIKVENAFKTLKTEFLEIRPLYLRTDERIKGHIFLSMLSYNIVLKLRGYIKTIELDFKSTVRELKLVKTNINTIHNSIVFESIPGVKKNLKTLFTHIGFKLPSRI